MAHAKNSVLDPQDQRQTSSMEDSTAMTIEFLRARLLSERSISRSARQRADELATKVAELEEQLRVVTLQRKMAEKATADVLAILENQGISDVSEDFESGSDLEIPHGFDVSNDSAKNGERSMTSIGRRHGSDELSGSDLGSSPLSGGSLSWKGRHDSPHSLEKYKTSNFRRHTSFSSISSSPKHRTGKSCRKIRHRQTGSVVEESRDHSIQVNQQEIEVVSSSEGFPNFSDGYGRDKDMEKALEHRAQLMDQNEAMEKAQRDWEEKFRENNGSTPDMNEEKDESKAQFPGSANSNALEDKAEATNVCFSEEIFKAGASDAMPKSFAGTGGYNHLSTTFSSSDLFRQENSHSQLKGNQNKSLVNYHHRSPDKHSRDPHSHGYPDSKQTDCFATNVYGSLHQNEALSKRNDLYALVSHEQSHKFSGALESLKQARAFLQHELNNRLPLVEAGHTRKAIKPSASVSKSQDRFDIPVGCSGLFRLPTDFSEEATARFNVHDSTSGHGSNSYLDRRISRTSGGQFFTNPYPGKMLSLPAHDQSLATQYLQHGSRFDSEKHPFDPFSDGGLPSSGKYSYPRFPIHPSYQNATPQMPFGDGLSRPYSSSTVMVPLACDFSSQGDNLRPNTYIYKQFH